MLEYPGPNQRAYKGAVLLLIMSSKVVCVVVLAQVVRTHALTTFRAMSLLNLLKLWSLRRPSIAPPSSIRSQRKSQSTCVCCRERKSADRSEMTAARNDIAFARILSSSLVMYSPRDCTTSRRAIFWLCNSVMAQSLNRSSCPMRAYSPPTAERWPLPHIYHGQVPAHTCSHPT